MKLRNIILLIVVLTTGLTSLFAQNSDQGFSCGHSEMQKKIWENNPDAYKNYENIIKNLNNFEKQVDYKRGSKKYIIPIVFHILHENGIENISDEQVLDQVKILNRDFNKLNGDTATVHPFFKDIVANCNFEFRLATLDPYGNCTNGINHYYSSLTNNAGENSKINQWNRAEYLNVWVVKSIGKSGVAGYAFFPFSAQGENYKSDGILIKHEYIGSIGTSSAYKSRALTHEIGHYLGLPHVWGINNDPESFVKDKNGNFVKDIYGNLMLICGDDGISDTPITAGHKSCPKPSNNTLTSCVDTVIFSYDFNGVTTKSGEQDTADRILNYPVTKFPLKANNLSKNSTKNQVFAFNQWGTGGSNKDTLTSLQTGNLDKTKYYEIKLLPNNGKLMNLDTISFKLTRNNNGIKNLVVRSNIDTFKNNLPILFSKQIKPTADITFRYDTVRCKIKTSILPNLKQNFTLGGYFTGDKNLVIDSTSGKIDLLKIQPGIYKVTYTLPNTTLTPTFTYTNSIVIVAEQPSKISYPKSDFCKVGTVKPSVQGFYGGKFSSDNGLTIDSTSGVINLEKSAPGYYKISYKVADDNNCLTENITNITIAANKIKSTKFNYGAFCKSQDSLLPIKADTFALGGKFTSNKKTLSIDSITGKINLKASSDGLYTVFYTLNTTNCNQKRIDSTSLRILIDTVSTIKYTSFTICDTASLFPIISGIKTGGKYSADSLLNIDVKTGKINFNKSKHGIYEISYTTKSTNGCIKTAKTKLDYTKNIFKDTINSFKYPSYYYCNSADTALPLIIGNKKGKFTAKYDSLLLNLNDSTGKIRFTKSKPGINEIIYTTIGSNKCTLQAKTTIKFTSDAFKDTINSIKYNAYYYCNAADNATPDISSKIKGKFSVDNSNLVINDSTGTIKFASSKPGIYEIKFTSTSSNKCKLEAKTSINYTTSFIKDTITKINYNTYFFSDTTRSVKPTITPASKGVFTSDSLFVQDSTGILVFANSKSKFGIHTIYYNSVSEKKCKMQASTKINYINTSSIQPTLKFSYPTLNCANQKSIKPSSFSDNFTQGGVFSADNNLSINSTTGEIDLTKFTSDSVNFKIKYSVNTKNKSYKDSVTIKIFKPTVAMSYAKKFVNQKDSIMPTFSGDKSGIFTSNISGLDIDNKTGKIKLNSSNTGQYLIYYTLNNVCHDTIITIPLTIITPEIKTTTNNEVVFVKDTSNNVVVSLLLKETNSLMNKFKDLSDTLIIRIYGWNAEDSTGTLEMDSLRISTRIGSIENIENFMEYSYCSKMFTNEQAKLMRYFLESPLSSRNNLWSESNLIATGVKDKDAIVTCKPKANFYMSLKKDKKNVTTNICAGTTVIFYDNSLNGNVTARKWLFENGTPATSTEAAPEVTFDKAGGHNVTLIVSNQQGTDTLSINNYVFVTTNASEIGYLTENFEKGYSWDWKVEDFNVNSSIFSLSNKNGKNNSKCLKLNNYRDLSKFQSYEDEYYYYDRLAGTKHAIITPAINLTTTSDVTISFDYAFATNAYSDTLITDVLTVYRSRDCGETWTSIMKIGGPKTSTNNYSMNTIVTAGNSSGAEFLPQSDIVWKNITFPLSINNTSNPDTKTRIKFEFVPSKYANNLFIDNININGTLQIEESPLTKMGISVYPNPVNENSAIQVSFEANNEDVTFELVDTQGKIIAKEINTAKNTNATQTFNTSKLNPGCYFIKASQGEFTSTFKVVVL